jgi:glycerophosphoryl diester phosphodiesterase
MNARLSLRLGCLLLSLSASPLAPGADKDKPDLAQAARKVRQIIAHRGSRIDRPENTLASARRAIEVKADVTETDVRTTRDGVLVCLHDADLGRTTNGKGLVGSKTLAELKALDAGSWFNPKFKGERIPTLRELLELCKGKIIVLLDLKEEGDAYLRKIAAEVRRHGEPKRTILGVRSVEQARLMRKLLPEAKQVGLIPTVASLEDFAAAGVTTIRLWPKWLSDKALVPRAQARSGPVAGCRQGDEGRGIASVGPSTGHPFQRRPGATPQNAERDGADRQGPLKLIGCPEPAPPVGP